VRAGAGICLLLSRASLMFSCLLDSHFKPYQNKKKKPREQCKQRKNAQENTVCRKLHGGEDEIKNLYSENCPVSDFPAFTAGSWSAYFSAVFHGTPLLFLYLSPATCEKRVAGRGKAQSAIYQLRAPFESSRKEVALSLSKAGKVTAVEALQ